jgi:hypothetical protein
MKKQVLILSLALLPITFMAQNENQPDSILRYRFSQNGDSTLGVVDARNYNAEGLLKTRNLTVSVNGVIFRTMGTYKAHYSYMDTGNEKITTISYLANNNTDTVEREIYTYKDNELRYLRQMNFDYYGYSNYEKRTYKGIRNYEYTFLLEHATGSKMSVWDVSELLLYHADTIIFEVMTIPGSNIWDTKGVYTFHYNPDNSVERVVFTSSYRVENEKNEYVFHYNSDNQCVKIEIFSDVVLADTIVSVKNYEVTQTLNENNQPHTVLYYTIDNEYDPYDFNYRWVYNYDNDGNVLSEILYGISDTSDVGYAFEKYYYTYNSPSNVLEYNLKSIFIFPNPAQSQFTITNTENTTIQLYNILGQKVKQVTSTEANTIIQTENLSAGMYVLKVEKENAVIMKKIQITK